MKIDEFESQFRSAVKERYEFRPVVLEHVVLVCDVEAAETPQLLEIVKRLVPDLPGSQFQGATELLWTVIGRDELHSVKEVVQRIDESKPNLIVTQRDLKTAADDLVYGLSNYLDAFTQSIPTPVLLLPDESVEELDASIRPTDHVMVNAPHLTGDSMLLNWGIRFSLPAGELFLAHIEDDDAFSYYMDAIGRIPEIDTEVARVKLSEMLRRMPTEFIEEAQKKILEAQPDLQVRGLVEIGQRLSDYRRIVQEHHVDLLIIHTEDPHQRAMNRFAYAIAVEFRHLPLLLL